VLDGYVLRAWVLPVVLVVAPLLPAAVALGVLAADVKATGAAGFVVLAVVLVVASAVRRRGRALQRQRWRAAGGAPTAWRLRHRGPTPDDSLMRLHGRLSDLTGVPAPSAEDEQRDPAAADRVYREWVDWLTTSTRDDRVVQNEISQYGFLRNAVAVRGWGMTVALAVALGSGVVLIADGAADAVIPLVVGVVFLIGWSRLDVSAVDAQSAIYANALLGATPRPGP
jgi:hypothetical protein